MIDLDRPGITTVSCTKPSAIAIGRLAVKLWKENKEALIAAGYTKPNNTVAIDMLIWRALPEAGLKKLKVTERNNIYGKIMMGGK